MAELAIKVGTVGHFVDGDILCAFNSRRIRCTHAQHVCHVKNAGGGRGVLRDNIHVARDFFEHTHKYRFERVSRTEINRTTLSTLDEVTLSDRPKLVDGKMQHMDVPLFIARCLEHERHRMFGAPGAEVWYGGTKDFSDAAMTLVWNAIETKTPLREVNFQRWPAGTQDLISHLFITADDFDEAEADDLVSSEIDETDPDDPILIKKRRRHIDWRDVVDLGDQANVEDKTVSVDLRETMTPIVRDDGVKTRAAAIT